MITLLPNAQRLLWMVHDGWGCLWVADRHWQEMDVKQQTYWKPPTKRAIGSARGFGHTQFTGTCLSCHGYELRPCSSRAPRQWWEGLTMMASSPTEEQILFSSLLANSHYTYHQNTVQQLTDRFNRLLHHVFWPDQLCCVSTHTQEVLL